MKVAKDWHRTPREWYREPRWSRATMVAQYNTEVAISWWSAEDNAG